MIHCIAARPNHIVLGYVPCRRDKVASPDDFNYDAFTHLVRAFIHENEDGSLDVPPDFFNQAFESKAREHGVKLLMSIGGGSPEADHWPALARNPQHVQLFLESVAKLLTSHHYDGIDIDWEPAPTTDADGQAYANFIKSIRERFPGSLLTLAMSATPKATAHLSMNEIYPSVDFINTMTYSYSTPSSGLASFNGNLHPDPQGAHTRHSVDEDLQNLIKAVHVPPEKILLGVNFWANRFHVDHLGDKFPAHSHGYADNITYPEVMDLLSTGRYNQIKDGIADNSYLVAKNGGCVITYDDPASLSSKCQKAIQLKCAGIMIWHIGADLGGGTTPLLSAIDESFGMRPLQLNPPAMVSEIVRLGKQPIAPNLPVDLLKKLDTPLRADRGVAEDKQWSAWTPPQ